MLQRGGGGERGNTGGRGCCTVFPVVNSHLQFRATFSNIMLGLGREVLQGGRVVDSD